MPFIAFSCLIAVTRTSNTMLNRSGERGHPCLVPDLSGKALSFCPLSMMLAVGVSYMAFIMLRNAPFIPSLLSAKQAFIAFLGTLHRGWSSFTMHRFAVGDYLLQITKERILLITTKRRMLKMWLNWLHSILGRFSTDFRKLL